MLKRLMSAALVGAVTLGHGNLMAEDYPNHPLTVVVPYAAGGGTDFIARTLAPGLAQRLGQPVVILNKPGAGTVTGASYVAKNVAPDGYTLLLATSTTMAINASLYRSLSYDPVKNFKPVALICTVPFALVVNPALPVHSVRDLVNLAKERPDGLTFASAGPGSPHHLFAELLRSMTGIAMRHVPYKGSAPALVDVVAGHVDLMFTDLPPALSLIAEGKLRALGLSSASRAHATPQIPPLAEAGVPGFDASAWQMVVAPQDTPDDVLRRLHAELKHVLASPGQQKQFVDFGLIPLDSPAPDELERFVSSEIALWAKVVGQSGATVE